MVKVILVYQWDVAPPKDQLIKQARHVAVY
jgi:hypothetical protein